MRRRPLGSLLARRERLPDDFSPYERAAWVFNHSAAAPTVAGLTRTLGQPRVSVGSRGGSEREVRITFAWELTWYQWGVDLGDTRRAPFELANGRRIEQLDLASQQWNAAAGPDGRIVLPAAR